MEKQVKLISLHRFYLPISAKNFPKDLLDTDIISAEYTGDCYILCIERERMETDEELQKRIDFGKELTNRRYATYLKLKKEFENA